MPVGFEEGGGHEQDASYHFWVSSLSFAHQQGRQGEVLNGLLRSGMEEDNYFMRRMRSFATLQQK
jgi:hypothetical protein